MKAVPIFRCSLCGALTLAWRGKAPPKCFGAWTQPVVVPTGTSSVDEIPLLQRPPGCDGGSWISLEIATKLTKADFPKPPVADGQRELFPLTPEPALGQDSDGGLF